MRYLIFRLSFSLYLYEISAFIKLEFDDNDSSFMHTGLCSDFNQLFDSNALFSV